MYTREDFIKIAKDNITRDGLDELLKYLDRSDFYIAPASTRYHDSCEGGLVHHSIKVYNKLKDLVKVSKKTYSNETLAIVALFHDLCKVNFYKVEMRNSKNEHGQWVKVPYYTVEDKFPFGHGEKSVMLTNENIKLNYDEILAIRWHMGGFEPKENYMSLSSAYGQCELAMLLHCADLLATYGE